MDQPQYDGQHQPNKLEEVPHGTDSSGQRRILQLGLHDLHDGTLEGQILEREQVAVGAQRGHERPKAGRVHREGRRQVGELCLGDDAERDQRVQGQVDAVQREAVRVDVRFVAEQQLLDELLDLGQVVLFLEGAVGELGSWG